MANNLISQSRQQAQNQMAPQDFWSWGNAKKFGTDVLSGAVPGAIGGGIGNVASAGINALRGPAMAPATALVNRVGGKFDLSNSGLGGAGQALGSTDNGMAPFMGRQVGAMPMAASGMQGSGFLQSISNTGGNFKALNDFVSKLMPGQDSGKSGVSPALKQSSSPSASGGPISNTSGTGASQTPYYSFEQFFQGGGSNDMRSLIMDQKNYEGVDGSPQPQDITQQTPDKMGTGEQKTIAGPQEDIYRPKGGISQKLYDATKYFEESPILQGGLGLLARIGAGFATGGVSELGGTAIGAGVGGVSKGIAGQLRQWLSVKQQQEQVQSQQDSAAQQGGVAQPLMQTGAM